jgi:ArsR family transcriptional regulator
VCFAIRQLAARPETCACACVCVCVCACDFTNVFLIRQPTVSQHLKVLREADLVSTRRRGHQICYSLAPAGMQDVHDIVNGITALEPLREQ